MSIRIHLRNEATTGPVHKSVSIHLLTGYVDSSRVYSYWFPLEIQGSCSASLVWREHVCVRFDANVTKPHLLMLKASQVYSIES